MTAMAALIVVISLVPCAASNGKITRAVGRTAVLSAGKSELAMEKLHDEPPWTKFWIFHEAPVPAAEGVK